jgi:hypothetical protein
MKKLVVIAVLFMVNLTYAQMTKKDFQENYINVKSVFIYSNGVKTTHQNDILQIKEVNIIYKDNGISIGTNSGRQYFIPYLSIKWVEYFGDEDRLRLYLND